MAIDQSDGTIVKQLNLEDDDPAAVCAETTVEALRMLLDQLPGA